MISYKSWSHKMMLCHGACLWNLNASFSCAATVSLWLALFYLCLLFLQMTVPSIFLRLETLWNNHSLFLSSFCQGTATTLHSVESGSMISEMKCVTASREVLTCLEATLFYQTRGTLKLLLLTLSTIPHVIWEAHECSPRCIRISWIMGSLHWNPHQC